MDDLDKLAAQVKRIRGPQVLQGLYLNAWLYGSLELSIKDRNGSSTIESLEKLNGACGHRDMTFREVGERLGWKSRRIGFHNVPIQVAHVGTEVWLDNDWRFFDPTFGIFLTPKGEPRQPISLRAARNDYPEIEIRRTRTAPFQKKWLRSVSPDSEVITDGLLNHPLGDWPIVRPLETYILSDAVPEDEHGRFVSEFTVRLRDNTCVDLDEETLGGAHIDLGDGLAYIAYANTLGLSHGLGPVTRFRINLISDTQRNVKVSLKARYVRPQSLAVTLGHVAIDYGVDAMTQHRSEEADGTVSWEFSARPPMSVLEIRTLNHAPAKVEKFKIETA